MTIQSASDKRRRRNAKHRGDAWERRVDEDLAAAGLDGEGRIKRSSYGESAPDVVRGPFLVECKARAEGPPAHALRWLEGWRQSVGYFAVIVLGEVAFISYEGFLHVAELVAEDRKAPLAQKAFTNEATEQVADWLAQADRYLDRYADARIPVVAISNMPGRGGKRVALVAMRAEYLREIGG